MTKKADKTDKIDIDHQKYLKMFLFNYKDILFDLWSLSKIYIFWILAHYVSTNLYAYFCTHLSFMGLILSPIMAISPHCKALHWLSINSILNISNMWVALTGWLFLKIKTD